MKVSVLAENSAGRSHNRDCLAEWGLSLYLEVGGVRILFDSGHKGTFSQNAKALGVDIGRTDFVVLSRHHWDHTGGLRFYEFGGEPKLVTHPRVPEAVLAEQSLDLAAKFEVVVSKEPVEFSPGIYYLGEIPRQTNFEKGAYQDDPMLDDTAIAIKTAKGTIIVAGCSHAGVVNIAEYAKKVTGQDVLGVMGGFHLFENDPDAINGSVDYFKREKPGFLFPMHCVDHAAMSAFYDAFKVRKYGAGDSFEVETEEEQHGK
jgi:7,8-dihydropterin-6-yl-methyl-4-(beta-D-ribofuranosyl)aminobenzene 5'-phosphate synthase